MRSKSGISGHGGRFRALFRSLGGLVAPIAVAAVALVSIGAVRPAPAAAQTSVVVAGHVGRSAAAPGGAMVDVGTELRQGLWGVRLGVGMDAAGTPLAPLMADGSSSGVWSSDADLGLNLGRIPYANVLFGRSDPTVFVGAGGAGVSTSDPETGRRSSSVVPTWSVGARGGYPITRWLGFEAEARRRQTFGEVTAEEYPVQEGWEYRVGLALRFGGATSARVAPPRRRAPEQPATRTSRAPRTTGPVTRTVADVRRDDAAAAIAAAAIQTAGRYVGTDYRWGGDSPAEGFDCSGFVQYVFRQHGIELPRVSRDQARAGQPLPTSIENLAPGDLLFFAQSGPTVDHVAIYAGDGRIVHSSRSGYGVRYDELTGARGRWYSQHLVAVRRVIDGNAFAARGTADIDASRTMPLDDAFEALEAERGDDAPPPETGR